MHSNHPVVDARKLAKGYGDRIVTWALRGVDFRVEPGEFVAVVGASGSGKSTLLNLLGALDRPTSGTILIDGRDTSQLDDTNLAALRGDKIGFIFQFHHLLGEFSIYENALMPLWIRKGGPTHDDTAWVKSLFERVGLCHRLKCRPSQLSGGQQQRAAIVRALAMRPKLILADEPTGNLDTQNGVLVFEMVRELNEQLGIAFVLVTHDDRFAKQADRIVVLEDGRIVADYATDEVEHEAESALQA